MSAQLSLLDLLPGEAPTLSLDCQRWTGRRLAWQQAAPADRFDARRYEVREIFDDTTAKAYILEHHYSGSYPNALRRFGLYRAGMLVGVAVFSLPVTNAVLTCAMPDLAPGETSMELGRLVLNHAEPGNSESWFVARCLEQMAADGVRGILSCADPHPRRLPDGTIITPGHVGFIYQALNGIYIGRTTKRTLWILPDGVVFSDKAQQKIRDQDQGHEYAEQMLITWGARPIRAGQKPAVWLAQAGRDAGVTKVRHHGCHRYVWALGNRVERRDLHIVRRVGTEKRRVFVEVPPLPYPKTTDRELVAA